MTPLDLETTMNTVLAEAMAVLLAKNEDYSLDSDALAGFKNPSIKLKNVTPLDVLYIYMNKHISAIEAFIRDPKKKTSEPIRGRIIDLINYCVLLEALITDLKENDPASDITY